MICELIIIVIKLVFQFFFPLEEVISIKYIPFSTLERSNEKGRLILLDNKIISPNTFLTSIFSIVMFDKF